MYNIYDLNFENEHFPSHNFDQIFTFNCSPFSMKFGIREVTHIIKHLRHQISLTSCTKWQNQE